MPSKLLALAAPLATLALTTPAFAQTFSGDTDGEATWNRPFGTDTISGVGTDVEFQAFQFTIDTVGDYMIDLTADDFDTVLVLYQNSFDPANQLNNILAYNDDADFTTLNSSITFNLMTGVNYFAIATGFGNDDSGEYTLSFAGAGTVTPGGLIAVPEPATWAMLIFGFGAVGGAMRSRRKVTTHVSYA